MTNIIIQNDEIIKINDEELSLSKDLVKLSSIKKVVEHNPLGHQIDTKLKLLKL